MLKERERRGCDFPSSVVKLCRFLLPLPLLSTNRRTSLLPVFRISKKRLLSSLTPLVKSLSPALRPSKLSLSLCLSRVILHCPKSRQARFAAGASFLDSRPDLTPQRLCFEPKFELVVMHNLLYEGYDGRWLGKPFLLSIRRSNRL